MRITESEFWKFFGLMLAARLEGRVGMLWDSASAEPPGILRRVDYTSHMTRTRFQEIRKYMAFVFANKTLNKGKDDWWQVFGGVNGLNENRKEIVQAPNIRVLDESMSAFRPRTTKTGNLTYLSFILRKPEPLGTEFKTLAAVRRMKVERLNYYLLLLITNKLDDLMMILFYNRHIFIRNDLPIKD